MKRGINNLFLSGIAFFAVVVNLASHPVAHKDTAVQVVIGPPTFDPSISKAVLIEKYRETFTNYVMEACFLEAQNILVYLYWMRVIL